MKTHHFLLAGICCLLFSCTVQQKITGNAKNSREPGKGNFIIMNDNSEIETSKMKFKTPLFKSAKVVLDNGVEVKTKDVVAYQDDNAYYKRIGGGFVNRIKRGTINTYESVSFRTDYNPEGGPMTYSSTAGTNGGFVHTGGFSSHTVITYYLEKKDNKPVKFSPKTVEEFVSDYSPSMDLIETYKVNKKKYSTIGIVNTIAGLGGFALMIQAYDGANNTYKSYGYGGVGLMLGGIVNGFINRHHKIKNVKNLDLAIDVYNEGYEKSKKHK